MPRTVLLLAGALAWMVGCAPPPRTWMFPARVFASSGNPRPTPSRPAAVPRKLRPSPHATPAAALVERQLYGRGLRFGTDGTVGALYGYLHDNGRSVAPARARTGDVVFFAMGAGDATACGDHVGLIESVDPDGRIAFREVRDGEVRHSFVHPAAPSARRDSDGRILNTFLRAKRPDDPPATRYFAGEMLCAVVRAAR